MDGIVIYYKDEFKVITLFDIVSYAVKQEKLDETNSLYTFYQIIPNIDAFMFEYDGIALENGIISEDYMLITDDINYDKNNKIIFENLSFALNHLYNIRAMGREYGIGMILYFEDMDIIIHLEKNDVYQKIAMGIMDPDFQSFIFQDPETYLKYLINYEAPKNEFEPEFDEDEDVD